MRATINELMDLLGVGYVLGPYETYPWSHYDSESGTTCSAEVRMGSSSDEVDAEIQMMYETPPEGRPPMEPVCYLRAAPAAGVQWSVISLRIKGESYGADIYDWETKACKFFAAVARELAAGNLPDIDDLIDIEFHARERMNDQTGGGGGKSPKIKPGQLLDMKKGGSF